MFELVVRRAEPLHVESLGVVVMMRLGGLGAAHFARLAHQASRAKCVANGVTGSRLLTRLMADRRLAVAVSLRLRASEFAVPLRMLGDPLGSKLIAPLLVAFAPLANVFESRAVRAGTAGTPWFRHHRKVYLKGS